jgi:hypothetical protein
MSMFNSHRDDRRRRALVEDSAGETAPAAVTTTTVPKSGGKPDRYTSAARRENHRRATDFVPRSSLAHVLWWLTGLTAVAGMLAGYVTLIDSTTSNDSAAAGLFQLLHGGSLIGWFSSTMFTLASVGSVLVYSIRRHRLDDYRGSYRLWLWSAAAWMVMSIDATANLHTPFSHAMVAATGWSMSGDAAVWWIGVWGVLLAVLALRLSMETRECRSAMIGIIVAFALWTAALAIDCKWINYGAHAPLIAAAGRLIGQVTLLLSIGLYARHVLFDAEGLLPQREPKPPREKKVKKQKSNGDEEGSETGKSTKFDSAHKSSDKRTDLQPHTSAPQPANRGPLSGRVASVSSSSSSTVSNRSRVEEDDDDDRDTSRRNRDYDDGDDDDDNGGGRKMSRAERKKLRKMQRQQRDEE